MHLCMWYAVSVRTQIYNIQMQATIIKELGKLPNLNPQLLQYLRKLTMMRTEQLSLAATKNIANALIAVTCQTRNLLHYRHLEDRNTSEKCLLHMQDILNKLIRDHPQLLTHIAHEFVTHIQQHSSCYVSFAFFMGLVRNHLPSLKTILVPEKLRKILHKISSNFQEAGEIKFLNDIEGEVITDWDKAQDNLQNHLMKKYKPRKIKQNNEESNISLSKIPPLILPSSKSIHSSRYSAISRQERTKGVTQLRQLASSIGQGFIAVELGCLLAHKRTQQVQQFFDNSDYRNKCLEKVQTERVLSSRLSIFQSNSSNARLGVDQKTEQTNRRYYKKVLVLISNLIYLCLEEQLNSKYYNPNILKPFYLDFLEMGIVGIVQGWSTDPKSQLQKIGEYFSTIQLDLIPISSIINEWSQRISFITEKRHLRMLWNRNKKHSAYHYEEELVQKEIIDEFLMKNVKVVQYQHMKLNQNCLKNIKKQDKCETDFVIIEISQRINHLFSLCDMNNSRFYKYEANLLAFLANYLHHRFSNTVQYLAIDILFPILLLIKRQIIELSHPLLKNIDFSRNFQSNKRFQKKQKNQTLRGVKIEQPLIITYPQLFCNFLLVISGLMSNHKHVQRLISTIFVKNSIFMQTLQRYVKYLFQNDQNKQIKKVLRFYRQCLQIYNQRKLRNQQSKSIKILFNHLSSFFYPKIGCIANKIQQKQHLISPSPDINENTMEDHQFLHEILQFIKDIYYYCQDELSDNLLEQQIASFYLKYSLINFIKLYSFITVNELVNLQSQGFELTTKESPHISYHPNINTVYMIDFIRIITSISINRTYDISKKIKQYRILEFFIREFELQFEVAENIQKYIKKVTKLIQVPIKLKTPVIESKQPKIPTLSLKSEKFKIQKSGQPFKEQQKIEGKQKKAIVPSLKLPTRSDRSESKESKGVLDPLIQQINQKPKKPLGFDLNLQLTKLNLDKGGSDNNMTAQSSERNLIYSSQRKIRKIYSNKTLHSEAILLVLSLLLSKGLLDPQYCDQFPITHGKINVLYILHHHLNEESNRSVIPILAETVSKIKPYLSGQRLLKLLSTNFTDLSHYTNWTKISAGAYGVIYGCETKIEEPHEVAIKEMNFPKSIYERCVLHDIFTQISCLENFRLDERITTMYNYGVVNNAYVIVMKKYDCSLRDWILRHKDNLITKIPHILKIYWDILHIVLLLHQKSVTHYDIKADNVLLQLDERGEDPVKVVLGDFGQCRIFDQFKQELDMKSRGTQCIKSPEMLTLALHLKKESDNYDRRKKIGTTTSSDIWSLGCLFYEMLTGDYLYHRADWVNFYIQVTSTTQQILTKTNLQKLQKFSNFSSIHEYLRVVLIRDPKHRPQIKGLIQKFKDLFGDLKQNPPASKSPLVVQKDLEILVNKYIEEINKQQKNSDKASSQLESAQIKPKQNRIRGVKFINSYNQSRSNKFMRIMEDIFFCDNINLIQGGYQKMKELRITHVITTLHHPLLMKFSNLQISFADLNLANLAFRLAPKISDLLRQVLLLKGRLLFINDNTNYATNLLIYTLSYWFRCSVYETWCLINTQILLFPTFTSDLLALSSALRLLNDVEQQVQELPKLQCICGSVTLILKEQSRSKKKNDLICKCKKKKINQYATLSNGPECVTIGCQNYLQFVKKRYSISWESIKWASMNYSNLLTSVFCTGKTKETFKTEILLNSAEPYHNLVQSGSCIKTCRVYTCRICEMMMFATTESKDEILLVMNNMLRRIRQGIMIPNAQQSYAKKTPALSYYTLTKLHLTKGPQQ